MGEPVGVHQAIAAVIHDLPAIGKDSKITEGPQKYSYRGIEQIKAELKPLLATHGVHYAPTAIVQVDDSTYQTRNGAEWQRVRLIVTYRIWGPDGSYIDAVGRGEGADNSDKACNKAMTVAEKQMLVQVFCVADGASDPDHTRADEQSARVERPAVQVAGLKHAVAEAVGRDRAIVWWQTVAPGDGPWTAEHADHLVAEARAWADDHPDDTPAPTPESEPEPEGEPRPTQAQMRKLMATLRDAQVGDDDHHDWATTILHREVGSFTDLTRGDVAALTDAASKLAAVPS